MTKLCSGTGWKLELKNNGFGFLAEISKQNMKDVNWFLLAAYSKMQNERATLKKKLLIKRKWNSMIWKILSLSKSKTCQSPSFREYLERG